MSEASAQISTRNPHERDHDIPEEHHRQRIGGWLPHDHRIYNNWMKQQVQHVDKNPQELNPSLKEFDALVKGNPKLRMLSEAMFEEIPHRGPYRNDPAGHKQVRDFDHMLQVLNHIMSQGPHFTQHQAQVGLVGVPMNASLDWPMATPSGYAFFLDDEVNKGLKKVLNAWGKFLMSEDSAKVLTKHKNGWFSQTGIDDICIVANEATGPNSKLTFKDCFKCDPEHPTYGYKSWDAFFTRELQDGYRPTASPEDDTVIANACESKPFNLQHNVKLNDEFWTKGNKYSLNDMFAKSSYAKEFEGGTVYQAFLSALSYHRWHAPISGTIKQAFVVDGTYFSEKISSAIVNTNDAAQSKAGLTNSQSYIAHLATRAVIIMEADEKELGLVGFVGIGMDEVSTCEITVKEGDHVTKGQETGMFHFGGSSHTLTFQKGVNVSGFPKAGQQVNVPVRSHLATLHKKA